MLYSLLMQKQRCLYCGDIIDIPSAFEGYCTTACYQKHRQQKQTQEAAALIPPLPNGENKPQQPEQPKQQENLP
jgi:hypothetical protein